MSSENLLLSGIASNYSPRPNNWICDRENCDGLPHPGWQFSHARPNQRPPKTFADGVAVAWGIVAGRGFGKTRTGAEWTVEEALKAANSEWAVVAPTFDDLKKVCFEGESGIVKVLDWDVSDPRYNRSSCIVTLDNGAKIVGFSAEVPRKVRGPNLYGAWLDEIAQYKSREVWDNIFPAIRKGKAQTIFTTTPAPTPLLKEFMSRDDGSVIISRGSTFDNKENLAPAAVVRFEQEWKGTRRERQELYGELLEDVPGALWNAANIESLRGELRA